ncbi:MAG: hypothetical protein DME00_07205, partial [Candidatus Rokuibacteriota bacterium]
TAQVMHRVSPTERFALPTRSKPAPPGTWLYTDTVTDPALSPGKAPERLVRSVGNGTVSAVPTSPVARAWPSSTSLETKFTTGSPAPKFAGPTPVIVKVLGAAARSIGLGVIPISETSVCGMALAMVEQALSLPLWSMALTET